MEESRPATAAPPQPLARIRDLANKVADELRPFCIRIEIAGSIRRLRPHCGDIDLVVLPKPQLYMDLEDKIKSLAGGDGLVSKNGRVHKCVLLRKSRVQLDVWIADHGTEGDMLTPGLPCNWGAMLITYTGSVSHNIKVVETAKAHGWRWNPTRGLVIPGPDKDSATDVLSVDESVILERLFGTYIEPPDRV